MTTRSTTSQINVRPAAETLAALLTAHASERPNRTALRFLDDDLDEVLALTYSRLDRQARAIAARLGEVCSPGDRALILTDANADFVRAFMACQHAGVIAVPACPPPPGLGNRVTRVLTSIARDCAPSVVLGSAESGLQRTLQGLAPELATPTWVGVDAVPETMADAFRPVPVGPQDISFLQYTSGSTSLPKGVVVTHRMLMANLEQMVHCLGRGPEDVFVSWLPLFHDMGLIGNVLHSFYVGAQMVLLPHVAFVQRPGRWLRTITRYGGTIAGAPNFGYDMCVGRVSAEERSTLDLSSWQVAFSGAEPVRPSTLENFSRTFAPQGFDSTALCPCYGLAEATLMATSAPPGGEPTLLAVKGDALRQGEFVPGGDRVLVGCGRAEHHRRVEIVDPETRQPMEPGRLGEIWLAGPDIATEYWERPEESAQTLRAHLASADAQDEQYLRTGDLGVLYEGELFITGRLKDIIILDSYNYYPQDIEATVEAVDSRIRRGCSAVFPSDRDDRERVVVMAELNRSEAAGGDTAAELTLLARKIRAAVATEHGIPLDKVVFVPPRSIPKTTSGKIQRKACRAAFETGELGPEAIII